MTRSVLEEAETPNLDSLETEGGTGQIRSTNPPVTCPAWPTYLTGKKPSNHRVFDFVRLDDDASVQLNSYENIQSPTLIDVMDETDTPSIFFEIPITFPVPDTDQMVIGGYPAENSDEKFSSEVLKKELAESIGEAPPINPVRFAGSDREGTLQKLFEATEYRFEALGYLLQNREWEFATVNFHLSDQIGHFFWDEFEKDSATSAPVEAYEYLDKNLGVLLNKIDESFNLIVLSDHGHGSQAATVNLNHLLREEGFLQLSDSVSTTVKSTFSRWGLTPGSLKDLLDSLGLTQFLPDWNRGTIDSLLDKFLSYRDVNWDATEAFAFGHVGQIYWIGDDPDRQSELRNRLEEATLDGQPLVTDLIPLREGSQEIPSREEPSWLVNMQKWSTIAYPLFLGKWALEQSPTDEGCHRPEGVIFWDGPDLSSRKNSIETHLRNASPTIHRLLGLPPQDNFDGEVIEEILSDSAPDPLEPKQYGQTESGNKSGEDEERIEQLKNLGYL